MYIAWTERVEGRGGLTSIVVLSRALHTWGILARPGPKLYPGDILELHLVDWLCSPQGPDHRLLSQGLSLCAKS